MTNGRNRHGRELVAVRPCAESDAARARHELPLLLAAMADEVGGEFEVRLWCGADATIRTDVLVRAADETDAGALAEEAATVLDRVAEVGPVAPADERCTSWPVGARQPGGSIGYTVGADPADAADWSATPELLQYSALDAVLVQLIAGIPEHGVRVAVSPLGDANMQRRAVRVAVLTRPGVPVSLRLRAAVKRTWPGLAVSRTPGDGVALRVPLAHLPVLAAVPVGGPQPLPGVRPGAAAPIPVPAGAAGERDGVRIGHGHTRTGARPAIALGTDERLRHLHVTGRTGTGKSSLLAAVARQVADRGEGLLVLDPHGHLVDRIIAELPAAAARRTWVIRSGDADNPVPLNPLAATDPDAAERAVEGALDMFQQLFDPRNEHVVGPRFRERVGAGLRALQAVFGSRASLLDVPAALADDAFLARAVESGANAGLRAWVENERRNRRSTDYGDLVSWCNSKFEPFTSNPALRAVLGSGHDAFDPAEAMDERRIILVDLSKSLLGEPASRLLGFLHLNRLWEATLRRRRPDLPFTVIVDEAHSVTAAALSSMLSEGRKFGLSVVLAHQFLGQLDASLLPAVDGNVATTVAFRGSVRDAPELALRFGSMVSPETLMTLPDLSAVMLRSSAAAARPHTLTIDHNVTCSPRTGGELESHRSALSSGIHENLVRPFMSAAQDARAGRSRIVGLGEQSGNRASSQASFLDEWLAKRKATAPRPGTTGRGGLSDRPVPQAATVHGDA